MIRDLTLRTAKYTIFLGLIGMFIVWAFQLNNGFIQSATYNGITVKIFDWNKYLNTLSDVWTTNALDFATILPSRQWDSNATIEAFINNMCLMFDWLYFPINFISYILRWICWVFRLALGLIGWDFTMIPQQTPPLEDWERYNSVLIKVLTWITQKLVIPYI